MLYKDRLFRQWHSQHPSIDLLRFWIHKLPINYCYKHWNRIDIFHCKRNKFVQTVLCSQCLNKFWLCTGSWVEQRCTRWNRRRCCNSFRARLISFIVLLQFIDWVSPKYPEDNSRCGIACRRLFFYHNIDDQLVKITLLHLFISLVNVFHPSSVKLDASSVRMSLLQIKHFPTLLFTDRNGF